MQIEFLRSPDLVFWVLLFLAAVVTFLTWRPLWSLTSIRWLFGLRILLVLTALILLLQPRIHNVINRSEELPWILLVDNSLSIAYHQNISPAMINQGVAEMTRTLRDKGLTLETFSFSRDLEPGRTEISGLGTATNISKAIATLKDRFSHGMAGIILISDGQITQGFDPVTELDRRTGPCYTIAIGDTTPLVDVKIHSVDAPTVVVKGEDVEATVTISGVGPVNERINISLMEGKKLLGSKFVDLQGNGSQNRVTFRFKPEQQGKINFQLTASSLSDELNVANNRQNFSISVLKDRYTVALMTGVPSFNTTLVKQWLQEMGRTEVDQFIGSSPNFETRMKSFWKKPYDLILFDNYPIRPLSIRAQRILARKIASQSSAVFWLNGPGLSPTTAKTILPLIQAELGSIPDSLLTEESEVKILPEIRILPAYDVSLEHLTGTSFPPLVPVMPLTLTAPRSRIIIQDRHTGQPILSLQEKGNLRSAAWTTPDMYSLYFRSIAIQKENDVREIFKGTWAWLMRTGGDQELYYRLNKKQFQQGEEIFVSGNRLGGSRVPFSDVTMAIWRDSTQIHSVEFEYNALKDRWEGQFWAAAPGHYRYEIMMKVGTTTTYQKGEYFVEESQIELNNVFVNQPLLKQMARVSRGKYQPWENRSAVIQEIAPKILHSQIKQRITPSEHWLVLVIMILVLVVEWSARRLLGFI
ncbi:MAG: hypothetical protein ACE5D8_05460 [Fidelibacterota bacterium]